MSIQRSTVSLPWVVTLMSTLVLVIAVAAGEAAAGEAAAGEAQEVKLQTSLERPELPDFDPFLLELQERTFRFFWDTANPQNGLIPDRYPTPSYSSIAAVGFGLTTYPIGVERGYITREQARQRV